MNSDNKLEVCDSLTTEPCVVAITDEKLDSILSETSPYQNWHPEILQIAAEHPNFGYAKTPVTQKLINSSSFQLINFMANHPEYGFSRKHLKMIEEKLAKQESLDIIQLVNKTDQRGLERFFFSENGVVYYSLPRLIFTDRHLQKRLLSVEKNELDSNEKRNREYFRRLSKDDYEVGHKDPRLPLDAENTVMQPSEINRSYKDNYIFDDHGLPFVPTPEKLAENPDKFYSKEDQQLIFNKWKKLFE